MSEEICVNYFKYHYDNTYSLCIRNAYKAEEKIGENKPSAFISTTFVPLTQ